MKKMRMAAFIMAIVLGGITSCSKDNSGTSAATTTSITSTGGGGQGNGGAPVGNTRAILESGTWKIAGSPNGQSFSGYTFNFSSDGGVRASYNGMINTGSWATTAERQDVLHLDFGEGPLAALNGDWQVMSLSMSFVQLKGFSGQGTFSFEKI